MERIAIFGATSGIAAAVARELLKQGDDLVLIGRSEAGLQTLAAEFEKASGRPVPWFVWDVLDFSHHAEKMRALVSQHSLRGLFFAAGVLFPQQECDRDPDKTRLTIDSNLTGPAVIIGLFAEYFKSQGNVQGTGADAAGGRGESGGGRGNTGVYISCVSSVAGDRGRGKVLAYAASKAGLSAYLAGLRHRLTGTGIFVQTVKPGFVRTRMTEGLNSPLIATPERVAKEIVSGLRARREIVYTPFFWRYIMLIIKSLPGPIFKRLKL